MRHPIYILFFFIAPLSFLNSQNCSHGATTSVRGNSLFLYFPTASDASFEATISGQTTAPLAAFDIADLDASVGSTAQLRNRIFEIVTEDFCEFNVAVTQSTTAPSTAGIARWQIVGIGSDSKLIGTSNLFGISSLTTNTGDADAQDFTRVWAASFDDAYGGTGGALNGANSTLERWATAIGSTTSHEAAHNYGLTHCDAVSQTGEDVVTNHIMNTGSVAGQGCSYTTTITGEDRAGHRRHFSDQSYATLAHNVGLNIQTLYNWDFINPNAEEAHSLEITLISSASALTISTWWNGDRSPWRDPTVSATGSTRTFQGTSLNEFILVFSVDKSWIGGADGVVPGGAEFHIGAGFSEPNLVIVYDTKLKNSGGTNLTLHPRMAGFNAGAADLSSGDFAMAMYNPNPDAGDLIIQNLNIQFLPRLADIGTMLAGESLKDVRGYPVNAFGSCNPRENFDLKESKSFYLGKLSDERFVDIIYDTTNCNPGIYPNSQDAEGASVVYCPSGNALSLFPSTTVYVTATVIDPNARYYDRTTKAYVNGPLTSKVFYQFAGILPDFNKNGIDDLIDIRAGTSIDKNGNGVPDEVDLSQGNKGNHGQNLPFWVYVIWAILVLIILILYFRKRKSG